MTIQAFPNTPAGEAAAQAVSGPKEVWYDGKRVVVFTGQDYTNRHPPITQDQQDALDARQYAKLAALKAMTPAQVQAWVAANVTNLAQAQDAIATLAIAVSVLARQL